MCLHIYMTLKIKRCFLQNFCKTLCNCKSILIVGILPLLIFNVWRYLTSQSKKQQEEIVLNFVIITPSTRWPSWSTNKLDHALQTPLNHSAKCYCNQHLTEDVHTSLCCWFDLSWAERPGTTLGCVSAVDTCMASMDSSLLPPIPSESDSHFPLLFSMGATHILWRIKEKTGTDRQFATIDSSFVSLFHPANVFLHLQESNPRSIRVGYLHANLARTPTKMTTAECDGGEREKHPDRPCGRVNVAWAEVTSRWIVTRTRDPLLGYHGPGRPYSGYIILTSANMCPWWLYGWVHRD
jgi:hypothetical protein